jgi:hypothetical protein
MSRLNDIETRLENIEIMILDDPDNLSTIKETCKGVFLGAAHLQEEIVYIALELSKLKEQYKEVIKWVKKLHGYKTK